ncbi:hypothetical protein TCDM_12963 [Trypanosoma cruzi Dm28c]|uniref:Uncharacterized protein n=1 Tax=Trypanosoma cruzi Dm28c TaxID=1416333 RepID=V5AU00_TRYCR|nr:hypothetical protein TCDM_12963 [Trypanosoma cruzi Dm28c]
MPGDGFPSSPPFFFSYSAINFSSFLSSPVPLLYSRELAAASSSDTGPISTMCVLSVSQRWSLPFLSSSSAYTGRVTSITFLLSLTSSIVAVMNPLLTAFTFPSCLLPHTRESVPSVSVHSSPLSPDSYTLRGPPSHAVIIMSLSSHSTTEGAPQPSSDIPFDSVQVVKSCEEDMISETVFPSSAPSAFFFVPSTGNTRVSSFILTPDPPLPISLVQESGCASNSLCGGLSVSFQTILLLLGPSPLTLPFTSKSPQPSAPLL